MWGKSKPKEREYTGFMGDTSPQQEQVLAQFRDWVKESNLDPIGRYDDYDFLRFCRARKFDLPNIQLMFTNTMNWRRENDVD
jgi:CRAL/TRIO, N-terminal domain